MQSDEKKPADNDHEATLAEARARMREVATKLGLTVGRLDAAGVLAGAAVALLLAELGEQRAADYLADLAAGVRASEPEPDEQHHIH